MYKRQGNEFYLSVYKDYYDVRLVFAPPSSVGKFGGDTDNLSLIHILCILTHLRSL